ncbi:MAG: hypothetical protein ACRDKY_06805, partial [Solirubrobacteraceae bacterium]
MGVDLHDLDGELVRPGAHLSVRVVLIVCMLCAFLMAIAIPATGRCCSPAATSCCRSCAHVRSGSSSTATSPSAYRRLLVTAVGDALVIAQPNDPLHGEQLVALLARPVLYLLGHVAFELRMTGSVPPARLGPAPVATEIRCSRRPSA